MRRDDAANGVTARQHDPSMIQHCVQRTFGGVLWQGGPVDKRATAGGAPVGLGIGGNHRVAMDADAFHLIRLTNRLSGYEWIIRSSSIHLPQAPRQVNLRHMHPPVRLVAIDIDGTLLPTFSQTISARNAEALKAAQDAGVVVAIATGRRTAYTAPLLEGLGLRANTPLITSNGAVTRTLGGDSIDRSHLEARVARGLCGLLRKFCAMVFTFDKIGAGELVLEDLDQTQGRISLWVEANRSAIEVVKPLENALPDGLDPIQGMVTGGIEKMKKAEAALKASVWSASCECVRTEYPGRDLSILDLLPPGVSKAWALERLAKKLGIERQETMAIGDNWNDVDMLEWAGQSVLMGNAAQELRTMAKENGWKQAPPNDEDGVAVVLEAAIARQRKHWASMARG